MIDLSHINNNIACKQSCFQTAGEKDSNLKFWEAESKRWKERKQKCLDHYKKFSEVRSTSITVTGLRNL